MFKPDRHAMYVLADALMKKGMKPGQERWRSCPFVLADALMKKGMKHISGCGSSSICVLADALMKKGMKPNEPVSLVSVACWPMP